MGPKIDFHIRTVKRNRGGGHVGGLLAGCEEGAPETSQDGLLDEIGRQTRV